MVMAVFFKPQFWYGSLHLYNYMRNSKNCLSIPDWCYVKEYFLINGYWFHPENVLLCGFLCPDSPPNIRREALYYILQAYERYQNNNGEVRIFTNPTEDQLNWNSPNFFHILRWKTLPAEYITLPPVLRHFTPYQLKKYLVDPSSLNFPNFLCHSQKVEEMVKKTTESVTKNVGFEKQFGNFVTGNKVYAVQFFRYTKKPVKVEKILKR